MIASSNRRWLSLLAVLLFALPGSMPGSLSQAHAVPKGEIILGCCNATWSHYALAIAQMRALKTSLPKTNVTVLETGGGLDNIKRLQRDEISQGQMGLDGVVNAAKGVAEFANRPGPDMVVLYAYVITYQNIVVRKDSGITRLEELNGKRFSPGIRGSSSAALIHRALDLLGIKPSYVEGTLSDAKEGVQNGQLVGLAVSSAGPTMTAAVRELATTTELRALGITKEQKQKIAGKMNGISILPIPTTASPGGAAVDGLSFPAVWATRLAVLDNDTAYQIAKAIHENRKFLIETWPHLADFDFKREALAVEAAGGVLHPGAKRYWESVK